MRFLIVHTFEHLSDFEKQQTEWIKGKSEKSYWDSLCYYVLEEMYSGFDLDIYDPNKVGSIFYNIEEAEKVYIFCKWFDDLLDSIDLSGNGKPNSAYLDHPEWPKVIEGAKEILAMLEENQKKYNIDDNDDEFCATPFEEWQKKFSKN